MVKDLQLKLSTAEWNADSQREMKAKAREQRDKVSKNNTKLLRVLEILFADYKQLVDSGDVGNWRLEDTEIGKQTIDLLNKFKSKEAKQ
jgi:hypothetical protein